MASQAKFRLHAANRLTHSRDFQATLRQGKKFSDGVFKVYVARDPKLHFAFGVSIGKKTGNAVVRNRYKRIIREVMRLKMPDFASATKVVIILSGTLPTISYRDIEAKLCKLFRNAGILGPS